MPDIVDKRVRVRIRPPIQQAHDDRRRKPGRHAEHARADRLDAEPARPREARDLREERIRRHDVVHAHAKPRHHPRHRAARRRALPEHAQHEHRKETRRRERERRPDKKQNLPRIQRRNIRRKQRDAEQQHLRDRHAPLARRVRRNHVVVDVVRQRVRDRQQQPVRRRQRRGKRARRDQPRHHIRQPRNLRRREHDDIGLHLDLRPMDNAVAQQVGNADEPRLETVPLRDPRGQIGERPPHQIRQDLVLDQHREHRHRQIEQRDEKQRPAHRAPRGRHRGRRVVARQDVRQARRAERQAQQQREEVAPARAAIVAARGRKRLVHRHRGRRAREQFVARLLPHHPRRRRIARKLGKCAFALVDLAQRPVVPAQLGDLIDQLRARLVVRRRQPVEPRLDRARLPTIRFAHLPLLRRVAHLALERFDPRHQPAVIELRHGPEAVLHRDQRNRQQERNDQDDVLRDLRPRDRPHPAQKRAHENPREAAEDADREIDADEARRDEADALYLRDQVDERAQDRGDRRERPDERARKARAQKIGNRVARELAHVWREQERNEAETARPAHQVRERVVTGRVQRAREADERRRGQPVGGGRHAIERGRHAPPGHVVFDEVRCPRQQPDHRIDRDRHEQEHIADPHARPGRALDPPQQQHERGEADRVQRVRANQPIRQHASASVEAAARRFASAAYAS